MEQQSGLHVRRYADGDESAVLALMAASLGWTDDPFWTDFFRWKHHDGPWGPSPAWVSVDGDRIVGFRAMMRWEFLRDGHTVRAVRCVDTATHPDYRGRGIFRDLTMTAVDQLTADGVDMVFNTPNDQSRPGYLKMGWQELGRLPAVMRPTGLGTPLKLLGARTGAELRSTPTEVGIPAIEAVEGSADLLAPAGGLVTDRQPDYLRWRYAGLPALHYRAIRSAHGTAFFRLRRRGRAVECVVADLLMDPDAVPSALRWLARHTKADYLIGLASAPLPMTGAVPLPGQGPILTWRALADQRRPALGDFAVSLGDIELF